MMSQPIFQPGLKIPPPSSFSAILFKDFQELLKEYNLEIIKEVREAILPVFQGVNYKLEEATDNEEKRQKVNMDELAFADDTKEELTISQKEGLDDLREGKAQVYFKKFFIMDIFSNLEWDLQEESEMEKFLKESSLNVSKETVFLPNMWSLKVLIRKGFVFLSFVLKFAFLFDFSKFQLRGRFFYFEVG